MLFNKNKQPRNPNAESRRSVVNAYYRAGTKRGSASPFAKKTPRRRARKFLFGFLDVILIIGLIFGLGYSLMIKPDPVVTINDSSFHAESVYQATARQQLGQLKNRNKITFNEQTLAVSLERKFPEITNVSIELPLFSERPKIDLAIAKPSFQLNSRGINYIVNNNGVAVAKASALPDIKDLVTINDQSNFYISSGAKVFSTESVSFVNNLIAQCRHAQVPIASLTLPKLAQELDLRTNDQTYFVKFYLGGDAFTQAGQFLAARAHFIQINQPPSQYLDVRISGKIFYK